MKRWRGGGGFDDDLERERERREAASKAPLPVQALAPQGRTRRFVLPLAIGAVSLLFILATVSRYVTFFEAGPSQTPPPPTPIAWLDVTIPPAAATSTPDPSATPTAVPSDVEATPTLAPGVSVLAPDVPYLHLPGETIEFVVTITNTSGRSISLETCPTYRMYVPGSAAQEPERPLNCAAAGQSLMQMLPGDSVSFEMVYTIPNDVGPGEQLLVWHLESGLRGDDAATLSMDVAPTATPA